MFIKQCKGIDYQKVKNLDDNELFYSSMKLDGIYVQVEKVGSNISFYLSSGKKFTCNYFNSIPFDFRIECEYIVNGGKLGTRSAADNEIKNFIKKGVPLTGKFIAHDDIIDNLPFKDRLIGLDGLSFRAEYTLMTLRECKKLLKSVSAEGWEGLFLKRPSHMYEEGKKSKDALKLKQKLTADLKVVSKEGDYIFLEDGEKRSIKVFAGVLIDDIKIGYIIEIEYEQLLKTYNQAQIKCIRWDKMN